MVDEPSLPQESQEQPGRPSLPKPPSRPPTFRSLVWQNKPEMPRVRYRNRKRKLSKQEQERIDNSVAKERKEAESKLGRLRNQELIPDLTKATKHALSLEKSHCQKVLNACREVDYAVPTRSYGYLADKRPDWERQKLEALDLVYSQYEERLRSIDLEMGRRSILRTAAMDKKLNKKQKRKEVARRKKAQALEQRKKKPFCIIECYVCEGSGVSVAKDEKGNETGAVNCPNCNKVGYFVQNEPPQIKGLGCPAYEEGEDGVYRLVKEKFIWGNGPSIPRDAWANKKLEDRLSQIPPGAQIKITRLIDFEHHG